MAIWTIGGKDYDLADDIKTTEQAQAKVSAYLKSQQGQGTKQATPKKTPSTLARVGEFLSDVGSAAEDAFSGSATLEAEMLKLNKLKTNTPQYKAQQTKILGLAKQERQRQEQRSTGANVLGSIVGGVPYGIADTFLGTGLAEAARNLAEQEAQGKPVNAEEALRYGAGTNIANVVGLGVGNAATKLGSAVKQGIAGALAGQAPEVAHGTSRAGDPSAIALDAAVGGVLGAITTKGKQKLPQQQAPRVAPEIRSAPVAEPIRPAPQSPEAQLNLFDTSTPVEHIGAVRQAPEAANGQQLPLDFGAEPSVHVPTEDLFQAELNKHADTILKQAEEVTDNPAVKATTEATSQLIDAVDTQKKLFGGVIDFSPAEALRAKIMPLAQAARTARTPVLQEALNVIDTAIASSRSLFRDAVYQEQYGGMGGAKVGKDAGAAFMRVPEKVFNTMAEKTKPFWNNPDVSPTDVPKIAGLNPAETKAWEATRSALDTVYELENAAGISAGKDPLFQTQNYMPRKRLGAYRVVASDETGKIVAAEGAKNAFEANSIAKEYTNKGLNVEQYFTGDRKIPGSGLKGQETFTREQGASFNAHREYAADVQGYAGQRNATDMREAILQYLKSAENEYIGSNLRAVDKQLRDLGIGGEMYDRLSQYMAEASGLGFLYESPFAKAVDRSIQKLTGGFVEPGKIAGMTTAMWSRFKVTWSWANLAQALFSPFHFVIPHATSLQGVRSGKLLLDFADVSLNATTGNFPKQYIGVVNRAMQAGYLQNVKELYHMADLSSTGRWSAKAKVLVDDPSMGSRFDLAVKRNYFVAGYKYLVESGISRDEAFHKAGQWVKQAFPGLGAQDKAPWIRNFGPAAPIVGSLTTYPVAMASQLYTYIDQAKKGNYKPVLAVMGGALLSGGIRGMPVTDMAEAGVALYNSLLAKGQDQLSSFDDTMIQLQEELVKQHPDMAWTIRTGISGSVAATTGLDVSRSLGYPGVTGVIPMFEMLKSGEGPAPTQGIKDFFAGAYTVGNSLINDEPLGIRERQKAIQAITPRQFQRFTQDQEIRNTQDELLGTISPEAQFASQISGSPSLEETHVRAVERDLDKKSMGLNKDIQAADNKLIKQFVYGKGEDDITVAEDWLNKQVEFARMTGEVPDVNAVVDKAVQKMVSMEVPRADRELVDKKISKIILRLQKEGYLQD